MWSPADKVRARNSEYKSHGRSTTFPEISSFFHPSNYRGKNVVVTNTNTFKKSFTYLLLLALIGIVTIDFIFRRFGELTIFENITNISMDKKSVEGEFTFKNVNNIFQSIDVLKVRRIALFQKNNGISVISIKHTLKNSTIAELNSNLILYTRDEQKSTSLQRRIMRDIEKGLIDDTVGLMVLLLKHKIMASESPLYPIIRILPSVNWFKTNGIFSMNRKDFDVASYGTSMEGIYESIEKHCKLATSYIYSSIIKREFGIPQSVDYLNGPPITQYDIQWAYMIVRSYSLEISDGIAFVPSLVFIRKTNKDSNFQVVMEAYKGDDGGDRKAEIPEYEGIGNNTHIKQTFKLISKKNILKGEEIIYKDDRSLTDSEIFISRGQWLLNSHKMILPVVFPKSILVDSHKKSIDNSQKLSIRHLYSNNTFSSDKSINSNLTNIILKKFDCSLDTLYYYYFEEINATNGKFTFCLKLLSYIKHSSETHTILSVDPLQILKPLERNIEMDAASIGISIIQNKIDKLRSSTANIINYFGHKSINQLPIIKVREAEMIILRNIIKNLHNWYYIVSDIDTYESYYYYLLHN
ncbi:putative transmembrane domain-containing protein [Cryptosporidium canis]|uniref:Transmembrane domain-containing protein n=1 Tax=Cryptosporidium canis TaxID=195482 RepID=A0A9D5DGT3_9CRYT|nr:putative transmembrane domain-containing protein [Cryptosporidium canis]